MIIERIALTNFRCFDKLELPLDRHLNVFVGGNGSGKTTILQALAIGLAPILTSLPFEKDKKRKAPPTIQTADIHLIEEDRSEMLAAIRMYGYVDSSSLKWTQTRKRISGASRPSTGAAEKTDLKAIKTYTESLTALHNADEAYSLPVFAFYGTNRAVDVPLYRLQDKVLPQFFRRLAGLDSALDSSADFRRSIGWFDFLERRELRELRDREIKDRLPALQCVRQAIRSMVDGIDNPRIDGATGRFAVDYSLDGKTKVKLNIDQLSDGYQVLLGVVMDFALRLALANPPEQYAEDALATEAVLIIDEVDLHLHPAWQQEIVPKLRRTFPNTQLILSTHSPQVLSTVDAGSIRMITRSDKTLVTRSPPSQTRGVESSAVMAEVMNVDPVPRIEESELLNQYRAMIAEGTHDSIPGQTLRDRLDAHFGPQHHLMLDCDRSIRFSDFRRRSIKEA